jgi:hypothetical protein
MEQKKNLKIRKISAYTLPFVSFFALSILIEFIGESIFNTNKLLVKYLLDLFISVISPIVFVLVGFYIEPENKKKTIKILSIILCVFFLFAIASSLDSSLQSSVKLM